jgi:hypothetical protein
MSFGGVDAMVFSDFLGYITSSPPSNPIDLSRAETM